jgi:hypothetical protein
VKLVEEEFVEEDWLQQGQEGTGGGAFGKDQFPGRLVFLAGVLSREVEEQIAGGDPGEKAGPASPPSPVKEEGRTTRELPALLNRSGYTGEREVGTMNTGE